jgi:hypothetical protein
MSIRILIVLGLFSTCAWADDVHLAVGNEIVTIEMAGKPFTVYHFAGDALVRPFFDPALASDATPLTDDRFGKEKAHPHHRSIWVAHGSVNGVDHWTFNHKPPKQRHLSFESVKGDTVIERLVWDDLQGAPLMEERRTMRFISYDDGSRAIDLTVALTAAEKDVTLGDTKEAGLCAVRVAKQISDHPTLINSRGAKGEKEVWGKPAEWADESGTIDGKPYGVAVFDHPSNPRYPTPWHARDYGLVAANEFGLHTFDKNVPAGAGDFKIAKGETATFRYRVLLHAGDATAAKVADKYREFISEK